VLNSFLQFLEQEDSDSLVLAATNHVDNLDPALFRRFDDVVRYQRPTPELAKELVLNRLNVFGVQGVEWPTVSKVLEGLSYAELSRACDDAARRAVLTDCKEVNTETLLRALHERQEINNSQERTSGG
jgi:SpoVK/Ycf46/Vps4 family AAA+-type ATPase